MVAVSTIRDELQTRLDTVSGLRAFDTARSDIPTPAAMVRPAGFEYVTQGDDGGVWSFIVDVYVNSSNLRSAQDTLDEFLPGGTNDIEAALQGDQTLNGSAQYVDSQMVDASYGFVDIAQVTYLSCQFNVDVGV